MSSEQAKKGGQNQVQPQPTEVPDGLASRLSGLPNTDRAPPPSAEGQKIQSRDLGSLGRQGSAV